MQGVIGPASVFGEKRGSRKSDLMGTISTMNPSKFRMEKRNTVWVSVIRRCALLTANMF